MQTKSLIQTVANVIKITELKKGDVIKIIEEGYSTPEIFYGVVIDLLNTGSKSFIQILRYKKEYDNIKADIILINGEKDIALFPASPEEIKEHLQSSILRIEEDINNKKEELQKKIDALNKAKEFVSGETSKQLSEPSFTEISQTEFNAIEKEKERKIAELMD